MYKNSKRTILFPLLLAAGVICGLLAGRYVGRNSTATELRTLLRAVAQPSNKLSYTLSLIENRYVDSVSVDSLTEHILPLLVDELDPHSIYIPAEEMARVNEPLEGEFDGIGVVFNMATDTVIVLNVISQGPSDRAGVRPGDRILMIDDSLVAGRKIAQDAIVKRLRGPRGSKVRLGLGRQGIAEPVEVEVERDKIPLRSIESAFRIAEGIGYIRLGQFARTSHDELLAALARLRGEGVGKIVFDLRGNSGGYLDQAILIANEFLHEGQLIVYTEDRRHEQLREYADGTGTAQQMEVAVLIDEQSASSSEILAGALQDNDRATIIGRRSFGKGLVQQQIPYPDGSALRLTTARYYTPTGRSIQKPYVAGHGAEYEEEIWERYRRNELFSADSIRRIDSLKRTTPGGKTVYGGGGIMPDLFVPVDTADTLLPRGGGAQHPLSLHDRIRRPPPRAARCRAHGRRAAAAARRRRDARGRLRALRRAAGRRTAPGRHRPLAPPDRGAAARLHRPQHPRRGRRILRQHLSGGPHAGAGRRMAKRKTR